MASKKLKPWQASIAGRSCGQCQVQITREEFRWRCPNHCPWDMCGHCYDNHWGRVIQEAAADPRRQRRLALLSAVPLERRQAKDFAAAFGDNPDDARLLLPPKKMLSGETAGEAIAPSKSIESELLTGESLQLMCPSGHVIQKKKKLKPWQTGSHNCQECQEHIAREEFRWRCEHHCDCDVCEPCYDQHWSELLAMVHKTRDEQKSWQLLSAVPLHLRDSREFLAAQSRINKRAKKEETAEKTETQVNVLEQKAALSAYGTEVGPKDVKGRIQGAFLQMDATVAAWPKAQICCWALLAALAEHLVLSRARDLQGTDTSPGQLPDALLVAALGMALAAGLLQALLLLLRFLRRKFGELPPVPAPPPALWAAFQHLRGRRGRREAPLAPPPPRPPPLQPQSLHVYLLLGVMLGLELGLVAFLWQHQVCSAGLHPVALLAVGLFEGSETVHDRRLLLSVALASLSGFLLLPADGDDWHGVLLISSQCLSVGRWVFLCHVLPFEASPAELFGASAVLGANLSVAATSALLELTAVLDFPGFWHLIHITEPGMVLWNIVVIGLCYAVRLLSYLNLARVASFPLMGLVPVVSGAIGVLPTRDFSG
ncbi:unnamed protein product, partial [Effrenium voratum]